MRDNEIHKMHRLEENHWWFQGKKLLVTSFLDQAGVQAGNYLDIGCGTGMFLKEFARFGTGFGIDVSEQALHYCRDKGKANLIKASGDKLPFRGGAFSFVSLLDVVEHSQDDLGVLREAFRVCKPGGTVIVTVPAFSFLWGSHDMAHHHVRRYKRADLARLGENAGFVLERISYTNFFIFLPLLLRRLSSRGKPASTESDLRETPGWLNRLLFSLYKIESMYLKKAHLPWGVSLLMVLKKPAALC
ncbi:bifunctional 2-polyprenyl-6-hydroxyphenol methylase/3-demethylubiquinol 3-O-methyltransferase UbiG [Geobacter sp. AOG1]|uniref:class I SAM-dependent methyltransferase n=1 Tax=Geobacter sp. AOG1 TaxID=1566346 RepID=UPI001CC6D51D|nr:class I SAM-dependent methyltransferase [Geobacter sp. AOG1]GFE58401.1 type 11 methyltransferase [Geobacter sp. AOG1]